MLLIVGTVTHSTAITPPDTRDIVVSLACPTFTPVNCGLSLVPSPIRAGTDVTLSSSTAPVPAVLRPRIRLVLMSTSPASGRSIQFVRFPDDGVPRAGVTRVGLLANTRDPDPVSSLITPLSSSEVVDANCARVPEVRASPPPAGLDHFIPVASAESAVRTCQLDHTGSREAVFAPVPPARSHFASHIVSVATDPPPDMVISPLPRSELPFTVLMFVPLTSVSCFVASQDVKALVSALSVFSAVKLSLIFHLAISPASELFRVCSVDIVLN